MELPHSEGVYFVLFNLAVNKLMADKTQIILRGCFFNGLFNAKAVRVQEY